MFPVFTPHVEAVRESLQQRIKERNRNIAKAKEENKSSNDEPTINSFSPPPPPPKPNSACLNYSGALDSPEDSLHAPNSPFSSTDLSPPSPLSVKRLSPPDALFNEMNRSRQESTVPSLPSKPPLLSIQLKDQNKQSQEQQKITVEPPELELVLYPSLEPICSHSASPNISSAFTPSRSPVSAGNSNSQLRPPLPQKKKTSASFTFSPIQQLVSCPSPELDASPLDLGWNEQEKQSQEIKQFNKSEELQDKANNQIVDHQGTQTILLRLAESNAKAEESRYHDGLSEFDRQIQKKNQEEVQQPPSQYSVNSCMKWINKIPRLYRPQYVTLFFVLIGTILLCAATFTLDWIHSTHPMNSGNQAVHQSQTIQIGYYGYCRSIVNNTTDEDTTDCFTLSDIPRSIRLYLVMKDGQEIGNALTALAVLATCGSIILALLTCINKEKSLCGSIGSIIPPLLMFLALCLGFRLISSTNDLGSAFDDSPLAESSNSHQFGSSYSLIWVACFLSLLGVAFHLRLCVAAWQDYRTEKKLEALNNSIQNKRSGY